MKIGTLRLISGFRVRGWPRPHQRVAHIRRQLLKLAIARGLVPRWLH